MSLKNVLGDVAIPTSALRAAGTYSSGPIANPGAANHAIMWVHVSAVGGSTQTIDAVFQTSPDGSTWTSIASSAITQLTGVGNASSNVLVNNEYVQVLVTIGGTGSPTATFRVLTEVL